MEVASGPTLGLKEHVGLGAFLLGAKENKVEGFCFIKEEVDDDDDDDKEEDSSESSSIGFESSSEDEDDDEVQSNLKQEEGPLLSLDSIQDSLPIKRGLSNFFTGKSKSFATLSDVATATAGELVKPENPFNKRRRILMASKNSWSRRASYNSLLPPLPPLRAAEEEEVEDTIVDLPSFHPLPLHIHHRKDENKAFKSPRSFSLSDLQHAK